MLIDAILDTYGHKEGLTIADGQITSWPYSEAQPSEAELSELVNVYKTKTAYREARMAEYPSIEEQLDLLYHFGIDGWKAEIKAIKDKHPKPSEA